MAKKPTHTPKDIKSNFKNNAAHLMEKINGALADIFYGDELKIIAKETNFVQRSSSRIKGNEIVQAIVLASIDPKSTPLSGIRGNLLETTEKVKMSVSGLRQRINTSNAVEFFEKVYSHIIESKLSKFSSELSFACDKFNKGALQHFSKILLHDSSCCTLHELLEPDFKGSAGLASKSLVKIDAIYDIKSNKLEETIITDVKKPDQMLSKEILKHINKDVLVIQDLGYFEIDTFEEISDLGGHYLSRLLSGSLVYLTQEDKEPIELGKHLQILLKNGLPLDIEVYVTKKKMKTRLVAYQVPEEIFNQRRREYNKKYPGKTASAELIARQRFTILITNVPKEIWSWEVVGTVYKIRWQIELLFKVWKSQLSIDHLKGTKPERIYCLIYARLLLSVLILVFSNSLEGLLRQSEIELSLTKLVNWLKRNGHFAEIVLKGISSDLWNSLIGELDLLCKENRQRNRKTTQQYIEENIPFLETFRKCA
jgi:Transposase DDE domain